MAKIILTIPIAELISKVRQAQETVKSEVGLPNPVFGAWQLIADLADNVKNGRMLWLKLRKLNQ